MCFVAKTFRLGWLLGICFWRKGREERVSAEFMGEKEGGFHTRQLPDFWLVAKGEPPGCQLLPCYCV